MSKPLLVDSQGPLFQYSLCSGSIIPIHFPYIDIITFFNQDNIFFFNSYNFILLIGY